MRWAPFLIVAYLFTLLQASLGRALVIQSATVGPFGPDFVTGVAVFFALSCRTRIDAMLAAWVLGTLLDLTTAGGPGMVTHVGPMAISLVFVTWALHGMRDAIYRDRAVPLMIVGFLACVVSHALWLLLQCLATWTWASVTAMVVPIVLSGVYTGLLMPLIAMILRGIQGWLIAAPPTRSRR